MSSLSDKLCMKCNRGGEVLVCSEDGCIIVVHQECLGCPASYADGKFKCAYCVSRKDHAELNKAREDVEAKRKALCSFVDQILAAHKLQKEISETVNVNVNVEAADQEANTSKTIDGFDFHEDVQQNGNIKVPPSVPEVPRDVSQKISYRGGCRRHLWTEEEKAAIRKGVAKFECQGKKNIPWKKILKSSQHVFHHSRRSCHLKDKWKTMQSK